MLGAAGVAIGWSFLLFYGGQRSPAPDNAIIFLTSLASVAVLLLAASVRGFRFVATSAPASRVIADDCPWQFTIAQMLAWTTVLAIVLGALKSMDVFSQDISEMPIPVLLLAGPGRAVAAAAALWAVFGARSAIARGLVMVLAEAAPIGIVCWAWAAQFNIRSIELDAFFAATEAGLLLGSLLFFRLLGYRLERTRRRDCQPPADTP